MRNWPVIKGESRVPHSFHLWKIDEAANYEWRNLVPNIDHVVVGPAGVFAVETKARAKSTSDNRSADAKVTDDGKCLHFPRWKEVKPLEQAKNQAVWLERWLSSATGDTLASTIPGRPATVLRSKSY